MVLSSDRDLLPFEPNVFVDVPIASQQLLWAEDGVIDGAALSSATSDFAALGIDTGHVVATGELTLEVVARTSAQMLIVSRPRPDTAGPVQAPSLSGTIEFAVRSFRPQAFAAHQRLRQALGLADREYEPLSAEAVLLATTQARRAEVFATLAEIYRIAQGPLNEDPIFASRHSYYERAFALALTESSLGIDTNADGVADRIVAAGVRTLRRV